MYMRENTDEESLERRIEMPPHYDGHLFRSQPSTDPETGESEEERTEEETVATLSHPHDSPKKEGGLKETFSHLLEKNPLKGLFNSDILLTAAAVWLLCNDSEDDDFLFIILLFFLFR